MKLISYLKKHWRGELDLSISYWVNYFFISILLLLSKPIVNASIANIDDVIISMSARFSWYIFIYLILTPWLLVGLFRSASNHIKKNESRFWANVVRVIIFYNIFKIYIFFTSVVYHQYVSFYKLISGTSNIPPYSLALESNNTILSITGGINLGLKKKVQSYIKKYKTIRTIKLESTGGLTKEAKNVAKIIEDHKLNTLATGICASACSYIFIGGEERIVSPNARFMFHRPYIEGISDTILSANIKKDKQYFIQRGVDSDFVQKIFNTPNSTLLSVSNSELIDTGVATKIIDTPNTYWSNSKEELALKLRFFSPNQDIESQNFLASMYEGENEKLPIMLDDITREEKIVINDKSIIEEFTILKSDEIENVDYFKNRMKESLNKDICNSLYHVYFLKNGVTFSFIYRGDKNNKLLARIDISNCDDFFDDKEPKIEPK